MISTLFQGSILNTESLFFLLFRFAINLIVVSLLLKILYTKLIEIKHFPFILFIFNILVFFFASFLGMLNLDFNFAFGLFAVFSLIRYRTQTIPILEMTFLFCAIIIAIINSKVTQSISFTELIVANSIILFCCSLIDKMWGIEAEQFKNITYERIDLITPDKTDELKQDLIKRTGLEISRTEIKKINFLNDTVEIRCFYKKGL